MYVVSVGSVLMMGIVRFFAMVAVMSFVLVMPRRHPSIVMVMDVRAISSTVTMVNRAHGFKRKLLLSSAIARKPGAYALFYHNGNSIERLEDCWRICERLYRGRLKYTGLRHCRIRRCSVRN